MATATPRSGWVIAVRRDHPARVQRYCLYVNPPGLPGVQAGGGNHLFAGGRLPGGGGGPGGCQGAGGCQGGAGGCHGGAGGGPV